MAEYHVGVGAFGIYAGTLNKKRKDGYQTWRNKSDATEECMNATAEYMLINGESLEFTFNGDKYVMMVRRIDDATD